MASSDASDTVGARADTLRSKANWLVRLVVAIVLIDLAVMTLGGMGLHASRALYRERAGLATQNLSRLLESSIRATFDRIDLSLKLLEHRLGTMALDSADSAALVKTELAVDVSAQPHVSSFQVFDASGSLVAGTSASPSARVNVSGQDVFRRLRDEAGAGLVVSRPQRGAIDGRWVIVLGRRLHKPDGSFGGVVSATLSLDYFRTLFADIDLGAHGAITLRDLDQGIVARKPALPETSIGDRRISEEAAQALKANPEHGTFTANTGSDDVERSVSYFRVAGYPFIIIVGQAADDYLADWRAEARKAAGLLAVFVAVTAALSWLLASVWIQREADLAQALKQTQAGMDRFRGLFQASPIPTVITSLTDGRIQDANDAYCRRYDIDRTDLVGHTMDEFTFGVSEKDKCELYRRLKAHGRVQDLIIRVRMPSGEERAALLNCETINFRDEPCALTMSLDVTDRQQAEQARQAMAIAVAANRAKTEFLSRISHELRTPLNAVLGFSELLESDAKIGLDTQQLSHLDHIQRAGRHLLGLINDVLDVSLIEAGQLQVEMKGLDAVALLNEAVRLSEGLARKHGVTISQIVHLAPGSTADVLGDAMRLRQVMLNLLSNAAKYNRPGGSVAVELRRADDLIHIDVVDTGIGMTREQMDHLYEPFNRLGRENGTIEGTGIGLALTRQLVKLMGGELHAQSKHGAGTRMRVTLSAGPPSEVPHADSRPDEHESPDAPAGGCVLYIEDNPVNIVLVENFLSRWKDVRLVVAQDGASGIELARALRPDLVLLDMHLPDMTGIAVLKALRSEESTRQLCVIAVSASAMPEDVARAHRHGVSDYWTKPLDFALFLKRVGALLNVKELAPAEP